MSVESLRAISDQGQFRTRGNFGPGGAKPVSAKKKHLSSRNFTNPHIHHNCIDINCNLIAWMYFKILFFYMKKETKVLLSKFASLFLHTFQKTI